MREDSVLNTSTNTVPNRVPSETDPISIVRCVTIEMRRDIEALRIVGMDMVIEILESDRC